MKKKNIFFVIAFLSCFSFWWIFFVWNFFSAYSDDSLTCSYASKFEQCVAANQNGNPRSITDFECLPSQNNDDILTQIIIDEKFKEVETQALAYLNALQNDTELAATEPIKIADDITNNFWAEGVFFKQFSQICNTQVLADRNECTGGKTPNLIASNLLASYTQKNECMNLAKQQLNIWTDVAYRITKTNRTQISSDSHQQYVSEERTKYEEVMTLLRQILGNIERVNPEHITTNPL